MVTSGWVPLGMLGTTHRFPAWMSEILPDELAESTHTGSLSKLVLQPSVRRSAVEEPVMWRSRLADVLGPSTVKKTLPLASRVAHD